MNLLFIFHTLYHLQNLSHTAETLAMSQPAVSQALKRLQHMYKDPLFERRKRKMLPTTKAAQIYPIIDQIIKDVNSTLPSKGQLKPEKINLEYRVNVPYLDGNIFIYDFAKELFDKAPEVKFTINSNQILDPETSLRNRQFDLYIHHGNLKNIETTSCEKHLLFKYDICVIARKDHSRLANHRKISMDDFLREKHAILTPYSQNVAPLMTLTDGTIEKLSERKVAFTGRNMNDTIQVVRLTDYLGLLPKILLETHPQKDELISFDMPFHTTAPDVFMYWHWNVDNEPAHRFIRQLLIDSCNKLKNPPEPN